MNPNDQPSDHSEQRHDLEPGQTIAPNQSSASQPAPTPPPPENTAQPAVSTPPATPQADALLPPAAPEAAANTSLYHPEGGQPEPVDKPVEPVTPTQFDPQMQENGREVVWTAAEFVQHEKSPGWYLAMIGIAIVVVGLVYLLTRDIFGTVIVALAAIIFGVAAARPPRQMQYAVDDHGVQIGRRLYPYGNFRSFSVVDEGAAVSIVMMPLKRFMPPLSLYLDPADEELISDILVAHLPYAEHQHELTERLMRRIRF